MTRPVAHPLAVRDRPQFELHLQGPRGGREAGRARARRALRARRQRAQGGEPGAHHRPADRCRDRHASLGRPLRWRARGHLRAAGPGTASVVGAIAPKLEQAEIERAKRKPTESLDAYDYFLRGVAALTSVTGRPTSEALQLFHRGDRARPRLRLGLRDGGVLLRLAQDQRLDGGSRAGDRRGRAAGAAGGGAGQGRRGRARLRRARARLCRRRSRDGAAR